MRLHPGMIVENVDPQHAIAAAVRAGLAFKRRL
jgi:hypothetical protein